MGYYWISWVQPTSDVRPLEFPPGVSVLGWWRTGYTPGGETLCALVVATSQENARAVILVNWPEAGAWRFCERRETPELSDRFPLRDWMRTRIADAKAVLLTPDGALHEAPELAPATDEKTTAAEVTKIIERAAEGQFLYERGVAEERDRVAHLTAQLRAIAANVRLYAPAYAHEQLARQIEAVCAQIDGHEARTTEDSDDTH
jgi:hypothetical protein